MTLWLYGKGKLGAMAREYFAAVGVEVAGSFEYDQAAPKDARIGIAIVTAPYTKIEKRLRDRGFTDVWPVYDLMEFHHDGRHPMRNGWRRTLTARDRQKIDEIVWHDDLSRLHHRAFISWRTAREEIANSVAPLEQQHCIPEIVGRLSEFGVPMATIKLHLEGGELAALKGARKTLQQCRPIISANVDHNDDGIWRTAHWVMQHFENYNFLFRNHVWCAAGSVIYAIPSECR